MAGGNGGTPTDSKDKDKAADEPAKPNESADKDEGAKLKKRPKRKKVEGD